MKESIGKTYEFILSSVLHRDAFSFKGVDTSSSDDGERHGVVGEVGRTGHTRESLADKSIGLEVFLVCAEELVREQSTVNIDKGRLESSLSLVYNVLDLVWC